MALDPSRLPQCQGFSSFGDSLDHIGKQVNEAEPGFAYHNHGYEFEDWSGTTGFDIILKTPTLIG